MRKAIGIFCLLLLVLILVASWKVFGPTVTLPAGKYFYVHTGASYRSVESALVDQGIVSSPLWFRSVSRGLKFSAPRAGKYEIKKGMSLFSLARMLKNGRQVPVELVIIKFRTKQELARRIGKEFETDSSQMMSFLSNNDSLSHYGVDTNTWACAIIPNTYTYFWNSSPTRIFEKLAAGAKDFWDSARLQHLQANGLSPVQASILASIIEEETNRKNDKGNIASVYVNRLQKAMPLQADPTIKFAMANFGLKRIYDKYLTIPSPYNTYQNKGLPPGPICTPSVETLEAVINAPKTNYIYFVANSDLNGGSVFTSTYEEHMKFAKLYQEALNRQDSIRRSRETN
jgi:UPF0755 protein